jgi:hypothetical protein
MVLTAASLVFGLYAGLIVGDWSDISIAPHTQLGQAVGASATVVPNQYNSVAAQIVQKEQEIALREAELAAQEGSNEMNAGLIYTTIIGAVLLFLILLNFYLDHTRRSIVREDAGTIRVRRAFSNTR